MLSVAVPGGRYTSYFANKLYHMRQFYNSHIYDNHSHHKGYCRQKYVKDEQISLPSTISKYFVLGSDTMDSSSSLGPVANATDVPQP